MDPRIWSLLPRELLEHVLSFLPLRAFLILRSTCKHFDSLLFAPSFVSKHSSSRSLSSFLLLSHPHCHQHYPLYDSAAGTWRSSALSPALLLPKFKNSSLISASNGLLCFSLPNSSSFLICNLLTKSRREIKFPSFPFVFELLNFVSTPKLGYKIFILASGSSRAEAFLYDSRYHSWQKVNCFDRILGDTHHQEGVYFDGRLYFAMSEPFSIVCFNPEAGMMEHCRSELLPQPDELTFARLVSDGGERLYLVGGIGTNGISRGMKLWVLSGGGGGGGGGRWEEVESLPELMCRKFMSVCYHNYEHVYCFWHQGMVCICCYTWPEILYYRASRRTWHWLPKCPSLPEKWSCGFKWYSFLPEISAMA
ncbi:F-box/kelch-repeat protein At5g43190 [Rhodamnia argentea]|uniref:F-box/kelch-repeat protein At5g43190 n=1 Tax=Rhodamnia argentea TaxID=178133 RepID=A0A8B8PT41_9MYRT|nr:F-box/kelch-repeat protein At5g43190 [Rhodamnia argentea]XP_030537936.1 F-box/kelch-repeat protein At5g43190 [Rhodamnia argentea]